MTTITTGTTGPKAWKIALVAGAVGLATLVAVNLPQTTSDTPGQQVAATATATLPEIVTGFEYNNESTSGQVAGPGVTAQYMGNSGELFPYENGPAPQTVPSQAEIDAITPVIAQEFLDGPSSGIQGASRVDTRAAVAAGLNPGAIDAVVGGTTQVAPRPDGLADAQARAAVNQASPAPALAASDEALVNPVPEVDAARLIVEIIASERSAPAVALAASDEALARGVSEVAFDSAPYIAYAQGMSEAVASGSVDWEGLGGPYQNGTVAGHYASSPAGVDPADIKFLGTSTQSDGTQRIPQQNVSMR